MKKKRRKILDNNIRALRKPRHNFFNDLILFLQKADIKFTTEKNTSMEWFFINLIDSNKQLIIYDTYVVIDEYDEYDIHKGVINHEDFYSYFKVEFKKDLRKAKFKLLIDLQNQK